MKKTVYLILSGIAVLYFILYPMALGLWLVASRIWDIPAPFESQSPNWLQTSIAGMFLFGGLYRLSPLVFPAWMRKRPSLQWFEFALLLATTVLASVFLLGFGIAYDSFLFLTVGGFMALFTASWVITRPLQIIGKLSERPFGKQKKRSDSRVLDFIRTPRLFLLALKEHQLQQYLDDPAALEKELEISVSRELLTDTVRCAIGMKIRKMQESNPADHVWYTYWLIVPVMKPFGAGLAGFKGVPDAGGTTEIGYGIATSHQNQGYMTEAVKALVDWAFTHPYCQVVTATEVTNPASRRLLEKLGAQLTEENKESSTWRINRPSSLV